MPAIHCVTTQFNDLHLLLNVRENIVWFTSLLVCNCSVKNICTYSDYFPQQQERASLRPEVSHMSTEMSHEDSHHIILTLERLVISRTWSDFHPAVDHLEKFFYCHYDPC